MPRFDDGIFILQEMAMKPVEDPLLSLERLVIKGTKDVESKIGTLHGTTERELRKEA